MKTTFTELAKYITSTYCLPKIMRDRDKCDPLTKDIYYHLKRLDEERIELKSALTVWLLEPTEENANAVLEEIADNNNFNFFIGGIVAGFTEMKRE